MAHRSIVVKHVAEAEDGAAKQRRRQQRSQYATRNDQSGTSAAALPQWEASSHLSVFGEILCQQYRELRRDL